MTKTQAHAEQRRHNYFSDTVLENPDRFIRQCRKDLKNVDFDTFVVRGMSGAVAGGMLARSLKKNLFVVRKDVDDSHDGTTGFGIMGSKWLFLDDFVGGGNTFWQTYDSLTKQLGSVYEWRSEGGWDNYPVEGGPEFVGAYLYNREVVLNALEFQIHLAERGRFYGFADRRIKGFEDVKTPAL